jgi:hypothetical protein
MDWRVARHVTQLVGHCEAARSYMQARLQSYQRGRLTTEKAVHVLPQSFELHWTTVLHLYCEFRMTGRSVGVISLW